MSGSPYIYFTGLSSSESGVQQLDTVDVHIEVGSAAEFGFMEVSVRDHFGVGGVGGIGVGKRVWAST